MVSFWNFGTLLIELILLLYNVFIELFNDEGKYNLLTGFPIILIYFSFMPLCPVALRY